MNPSLYLQVQDHSLERDLNAARMVQWASAEVAPPQVCVAPTRKVTSITVCAGSIAHSARTIEHKVHAAHDKWAAG